MYLLAKFQLHILKVLEVTALQSTSNRKIDLYSKYRGKRLLNWMYSCDLQMEYHEDPENSTEAISHTFVFMSFVICCNGSCLS